MIKYCKISELCKIYSGNSINEKIKKEKYTNDNNGIEYISTKDIGYNLKINYNNGIKIPHSDLEKFRTAPPYTVFICAEGGSAGRKLAISDRQLCFVNKLFAIVSSEKVLPKFIFYFIQSENFNKQFKSAITGLIGGVSLNKFKEFEIPILPISTQQKIVAKLDKIFAEIDKAIAKVESNAKNVEVLFQSYLMEVFQHITNNSKTVLLGRICKVIAGQSPKSKNYNRVGKGLPFYQGKKDFGEIYINSPTVWSTEITREADKNDILMSVRAPVGPINIATERICIGRGLAAIRVSENINQTYLYNYLLKIEKDLIGNVGAVFNSISKTQIENLKIPLPTLVVQQKLANKITDIKVNLDFKYQIQIKKIKELIALKKSILKQSFNGELVKAA